MFAVIQKVLLQVNYRFIVIFKVISMYLINIRLIGAKQDFESFVLDDICNLGKFSWSPGITLKEIKDTGQKSIDLVVPVSEFMCKSSGDVDRISEFRIIH